MPTTLEAQLSNGHARLRITGSVGSACTIQTVSNLFLFQTGKILTKNWQFITNFTLASNSAVLDAPDLGTGQRFYRAFTQAVPTNTITTNMVWISPGTFTMGAPDSEPEHYPDETPQTIVTITHGFWIGKFEVTQAEYSSITGTNPSYFADSPDADRKPIEMVSWNEAVAYCAALTAQEQAAGHLPAGYAYRLPTEAEWEYACRAGTETSFHYGPALRSGMANFDVTYEYDSSAGGTIYNPNDLQVGGTTPVGSYPPNAWGLFDMHGNVLEWCQDGCSINGLSDLPGGSVTDPQGSGETDAHIIRGGGWGNFATDCRAASRDYNFPDDHYFNCGFRVVLVPLQP